MHKAIIVLERVGLNCLPALMTLGTLTETAHMLPKVGTSGGRQGWILECAHVDC